MLPIDQGDRTRKLGLIDMQSGGDVSRIVYSGVAGIPGDNTLEKMRYLQSHGDGLRRLLLYEPYGDPAMSVDLIVPPGDARAQAGYIIMEAMGYPLYSGSNTICTATALLQSGLVPMQEGEQTLVLESPLGLVQVTASNRNGRVESIVTQGEPAYVAARDRRVTLSDGTLVDYAVVWSGHFFALLDAEAHGFSLVADEMPALAAFGDRFVGAVREDFQQDHPLLGQVGPVPFAHFMGPLETTGNGYRSRSATYVHPGVICRSPTGTGTSARLALMAARGQVEPGQTLQTVSPRGGRFTGTYMGDTAVGERSAINSNIRGSAGTLSHAQVLVDLDDPLVDASDLEHLLSSDSRR